MATEHRKYLSRGPESMLNQVPIDDGKLRFTTDTGRLFMDVYGSRIEITDFVKNYTEEEIKAILTPLPKIYISSDTLKFFVHDGENWICLDKSSEADHATNADTATYSVNAGTATYATNASTADYTPNASTAVYANASKNADTATYATNAGTSAYSEQAAKDSNGKVIGNTYAPLSSPIFTGTPSVPTAAEGTNNKQVANTEYVVAAIASALSQITGFDTKVLSSLPESGEKGIIYFIPSDNPEEDNKYIEYIWCEDKFEKVGDTKIDLSGYAKEVTTSGIGNAVTGVEYRDGKITLKKDSTFLTAHPSVTTNSTTGTENPEAGKTFDVIDGVVTDKNGHVTAFRKKTVTMPNSVSKATNADTAVYATSAGKALKDNKDQQIDSTYIKNLAVVGKTITATRGDGTTFSFNTQDNNTTYGNYKGATTADNGVSGLVPAASKESKDQFLRGDGTWATPLNAGTSTFASRATNADTATYAKNAGTSNFASSSSSANNASTAEYAQKADTANTASSASVSDKAKAVDDEGDFDYGDLDEE